MLPIWQLLLLQCDPGVGVDRFFHALYTKKSTRMVMLLGSACSEVTESLAKVVPYWNMVQVNRIYWIFCYFHFQISNSYSNPNWVLSVEPLNPGFKIELPSWQILHVINTWSFEKSFLWLMGCFYRVMITELFLCI